MSVSIRCDRCGVLLDFEHDAGTLELIEPAYGMEAQKQTENDRHEADGKNPRWDFCGECARAFQKWVQAGAPKESRS